jgi:hypothetical protein
MRVFKGVFLMCVFDLRFPSGFFNVDRELGMLDILDDLKRASKTLTQNAKPKRSPL